MSKEISNTLFRMVNTRNPQTVKDEDKKLYFVFRPMQAKGVFDEYLASNTDALTNWQKLVKRCKTFKEPELVSVEKIKKNYPSFYEFGVWIARNSENATTEDLKNRKASVENTEVDLKQIWDNFIYQAITQQSFEAKEAFMHLLKGIHVFKNFQEYSSEDKQHIIDTDALNLQLLKSKVVFPDLFATEENNCPVIR